MSEAIDAAAPESLFAGDSEMARQMRSHDWSQTSLGTIETWSDSLKTAVQILLTELDQAQLSGKMLRDSDLLPDRAPSAVPCQAAQTDVFRARLTNALRPLTDANEIQATAAYVLGESLGVSRVIYLEVLPGGKEVIVHKNYTSGVAELSGLYHLEDFGRNLADDHRAGQTAIVPDVTNCFKYTAKEKARFRAIDIAAHIDVPLIKNEQFVALLAVHHLTPRQWTEDEVKRAEETAELTWSAVERARAETALRQSRRELERQLRKFDEIVAAIPDFIYTFDLAGRFTYISPALLNLWQKTSDEALGKNFFELDYPTDLATRLQHQLQQVIQMRQPLKDETPYTSAIGTRAYEYIFVPLFSADGVVEAVAGVTRDITDRKRSEEELRVSEQRFRDLADNAPMMVWVTDPTGYCSYLSRSWYDFSGQTEADGLGVGWLDVVHPDDYESAKALFLSANQRQEAFQLEYRLRCKDGKYRTCIDAARPWLGADGEFQGYIGSVIDIEDRIQAEAALRQSEEQTRNILESIHESFFALDENWQFTYVNRSAEVLLDRTPGDLIGKNLWEEYPGWSSSELAQVYRSAMRDRVAASLTTFYPDHDRWYEVRTYPAPNGITVYFRNITEKVQTAATLRQSEERYRTLFESIDEGFCVIEMLFDQNNTPIDYRFLEVNPAFEHQAGLQQAVGKTARQLNLEDHWIDTYGQVALTGESVRFESGSTILNRWFDAYACRIGEPEARKVAIVFKDISDRKRAEEISQRTAKLDAFRVSLADAIRPLADPVEVQATASRVLGQYLGANRVAYFEVRGADYVVECDYVNGADGMAGGYPIDSFGPKLLAAYRIGHTVSVSDVAADPNLSPDQRATYTAIQIGAYIGIPLVKGGEFVAGLAVHSAGPRAWTPNEVDLAEEVAERTWAAVDRARAEAMVAADLQDTQRLRELGAKLATEGDIPTLYQEILSAAISITRADAGTVQIFDAATQELVLLASQGFEQSMTQHFHRVSARSNTPCGIALKYNARSVVDFEVPQSEDPDGAMRMHVENGYLSGQSTPLTTRAGQSIGMVSTYWRTRYRPSERELRFLDLLTRQAADLIEQRQTAAEREQLLVREQAARADADHANRVKDEFLAVLSHELRSPLNPILGWSKLLQQRKLDAARTTTALATIERNAQLQVQLIDDLLDISRIIRGKLSLTVMPVDPSTIISEAMETVRLAAEAKAIEIHTTISPGVGIVLGDAGRLQQVVWNLLSNAVKFTPQGGQVTVALAEDENHAQLQVSDTGKGIKSDFLPYVFEHFRQEDGATTRKFGGLGLGLAIVRQIVELHGGTVAVDSPGEGQGATFTVRIPLASRLAVVPEIEPPSSSVGDLSGIHILVVDDEADSGEVVTFVLEQAGAFVTTVASGIEALQAFSQTVPDLLVSDIGMPEMDGYMLIREIRRLPREQGGQISAIALTAYAGELNQQQALASGFQRHLDKPIDPEKVVALVIELVSGL